jgi:hypothetical protein
VTAETLNSDVLNWDGGDCTLRDFLTENRHTLTSGEIIRVCRLAVGESMTIPVHFGQSQIVRTR